MTTPVLPTPEQTATTDNGAPIPGYFALRDLVGATIEVKAVEEHEGYPVLLVDDDAGATRRYLALGEWAEKTATALEGHLNAGAGPATVRVVEEKIDDVDQVFLRSI